MNRDELIALAEQEFAEGYRDGRDLTAPEPGPNRSPCYAHSWKVGRREALRDPPVPAEVAREQADAALLAKLGDA